MKYVDYKERKEPGTFNFPIALYTENPRSPRYDMPHHWHTHCEIIRILSGSFPLTINKEMKVYEAGDVIFISPGFIHGGIPCDGCTYECIVFNPEILLKENHICAKTIHEIIDHKIMIYSLLSAHSPNFLSIVDSLSFALSSTKPGYEFMTQGFLHLLIGTILAENLYEKNEENKISNEHLSSIKKVLAFISENYANRVTLDDMARIAGMNSRYFCRYFRSMTDRTPIDYLNYYRIECACEMLSTRNISIKETAISCGFNDESYFIKTFHKYKGVTPKQYMTAEF